MTRSDFLLHLWKRILKPIILALVIYYVIQLLYALLSENGPGRLLITIALFLGIVLFVLELMTIFLAHLKKRLYAPLPESLKRIIRMIMTINHYLFLGVLLVIIWYSLSNKSITEILFLSLVLTADKLYYLLTSQLRKRS